MNKQSQLVEPTYYYKGLDQVPNADGVWPVGTRWPDVKKWADLRSTDHVLDVGCAEGLVTCRAAKFVESIHGVEISPKRVEAAKAYAIESETHNATFESCSVESYHVTPLSYDVVLFLGVFQHLPKEHKMPVLNRLLAAARRQVVIRVPVLSDAPAGRLVNITARCTEHGFTLTTYPKVAASGGSLLIATRLEQQE